MAIIAAVPASTTAFAIHGFTANLVLCYSLVRNVFNACSAIEVIAVPVGFRGSRIDKENLVSSPKSLVQVPGIDFVLELRFVVPSSI